MEEASLKVRDVTYYATQPWPFPSSLMIGCFARAENRDAKADENELAEVRWLEETTSVSSSKEGKCAGYGFRRQSRLPTI